MNRVSDGTQATRRDQGDRDDRENPTGGRIPVRGVPKGTKSKHPLLLRSRVSKLHGRVPETIRNGPLIVPTNSVALK